MVALNFDVVAFSRYICMGGQGCGISIGAKSLVNTTKVFSCSSSRGKREDYKTPNHNLYSIVMCTKAQCHVISQRDTMPSPSIVPRHLPAWHMPHHRPTCHRCHIICQHGRCHVAAKLGQSISRFKAPKTRNPSSISSSPNVSPRARPWPDFWFGTILIGLGPA